MDDEDGLMISFQKYDEAQKILTGLKKVVRDYMHNADEFMRVQDLKDFLMTKYKYEISLSTLNTHLHDLGYKY